MNPKQWKPPQAPPTFAATPESLATEARVILKATQNMVDNILKQVTQETATFNNVILPKALDDNNAALKCGVMGFYQYVGSSETIRNASREFFPDRKSLVYTESMYKLVEAVYQKNEPLDPESRRLVEEERKIYIRQGFHITTGPERDRLQEIQQILNTIGSQFKKNLSEESSKIWLEEHELEGVPEDTIQKLERSGVMFGLTLKSLEYWPIVRYASRSDTRRKIFIANELRNAANAPLFKEMIVLRDEAARLLGYPNHATLRIEENMAKTLNTVQELLGDIRKYLVPVGVTQSEYLNNLKQKDLKSSGFGSPSDENFYIWDFPYSYRLMMENDNSINQQQVAEYFPLESTVEGILHMLGRIFGLVFRQIDKADYSSISQSGSGDDIVWHEDVKLFSVWDDEKEGGAFSGYLYLDLHPRPGKPHAKHISLQPGFLDLDGTRRYPASVVFGNYSKPTTSEPSLMHQNEVQQLIHELTHGIHNIVGRNLYSTFHGTSVPKDFVEIHSFLLEKWYWTQLKSLGKHYKTGMPMDDDLIERLSKTRDVFIEQKFLSELLMAIFDLEVHTPASHKEINDMDVSQVFCELGSEILSRKGLEASSAYANMDHQVVGYDASYYCYIRSRAWADDIYYTFFVEDPMNDTEGRRYRHGVLAKGGSQDTAKILEDYLGRKPSTVAFFSALGLDVYPSSST